ncbi:hypothetical protein EMIT0P176_20282 [Pseudomonas sp. IT-P176]
MAKMAIRYSDSWVSFRIFPLFGGPFVVNAMNYVDLLRLGVNRIAGGDLQLGRFIPRRELFELQMLSIGLVLRCPEWS